MFSVGVLVAKKRQGEQGIGQFPTFAGDGEAISLSTIVNPKFAFVVDPGYTEANYTTVMAVKFGKNLNGRKKIES